VCCEEEGGDWKFWCESCGKDKKRGGVRLTVDNNWQTFGFGCLKNSKKTKTADVQQTSLEPSAAKKNLKMTWSKPVQQEAVDSKMMTSLEPKVVKMKNLENVLDGIKRRRTGSPTESFFKDVSTQYVGGQSAEDK